MQYVWSGLLILMGLHWNLLRKRNPDWMLDAAEYCLKRFSRKPRKFEAEYFKSNTEPDPLSVGWNQKDSFSPSKALITSETIDNLHFTCMPRYNMQSMSSKSEKVKKFRKASSIGNIPRSSRKNKTILSLAPILMKPDSASTFKRTTNIDKIMDQFHCAKKNPLYSRRSI